MRVPVPLLGWFVVGCGGVEPAATVRPTAYDVELEVTPGAATFAGRADLALALDGPTREIVIDGAGLTVGSVALWVDGRPIAAEYHERPDERAEIRLAAEAPAGPATLSIGWVAPVRTDSQGVYQASAGGDPYVVTQFEPMSARSALPCFDAPEHKAPLTLALVTPAGAVALANAPVAATETLPDGRVRTRFAPTPPLPTYLFAFAVGPFERAEGPALPATPDRPAVPVSGYAVRGHAAELAVALELVPGLVGDLEAYFDSPYPFEKLDLVAAPDFDAGAMENPGLLVFREAIVLSRDGVSSSRRLLLAQTLAHELAHQWFGNRVSLRRWDDLWLNEGFASWMEHRSVARWEGGERAGESFQAWVHAAMEVDALGGSRAVAAPVRTPDDVYAAFDDITYAKGAAVLGMVEHHLGPDAFRAAVRRYLGDGFHSATTDEFLSALDDPATRAFASTFLERPGVPTIGVDWACDAAGAAVTLSQADGSPWEVPVCLRLPTGEVCATVGAPPEVLALPSCPAWILPNAGGAGYYRWRVPPAGLRALAASAGALSPRERVVVADAVWSEFSTGDTDLDTLSAALTHLAQTDAASGDLLDATLAVPRLVQRAGGDGEPFRRWVRATYGPGWRRVGWTVGAGESESVQASRAPLLEAVGGLGADPDVRREAAHQVRAALDGGSALAPDVRRAAFRIAAAEGSPALFDALVAHLRGSDDGSERRTVWGALASFPDPALAERARELALGPDARNNEVLEVLTVQLASPTHRDAAWQFVERSTPRLLARLPDSARAFLPSVAAPLCDEAAAGAVSRWFDTWRAELPGAEPAAASAVASIRRCAALAVRRPWPGGTR